ncbi:MAG: O-antigen ligase family protein [Rhodospirillales bacterium]|nr:O-antigen ligase family protein [Rhodospirillales bacterium]
MNRGLAILFGVLAGLPILIALHMARGVAPLFALLCLGALALHLWPRRQALAVAGPYAPLLAAFCLWAVLSALWSFDILADGWGALRLGLMMAGGLLLVSAANRLDARQGMLFRRAFALTYAALALLIAVDLASGMQVMRVSYALRNMYPPPDFNYTPDSKHRAVMLAVLLAPAFLAARREWGLKAALPLAAGAAGIILLHHSETSLICLVGLALAAPFAFKLPRLALWSGIVGLALLFAAPPFLHERMPEPVEIQRAHPWLSPSLLHRFVIWDYALGRIAERPVLGFGFDAAREIGGREPKRHYYFDTLPDGKKLHPYFEPIPLHTHNGIIQLWLELGGVGAAIAVLLLILTWKGALATSDPWRRAGSAALFVAAMGPMLSSYGLFQAWWVGSVWIAIAALRAEQS